MKAFSANIYKRSLPRWPSYTCASGNRLAWDASETATNLYAYDGAGRLTNHVVNGPTRTFAYHFQGRMTSLTDIDGSVFAYEFDGEGNRLSQSLNDCLSKRFVYDGADVLLELNPTNGVAYAWVNGPGIDQPIERLLFIDGEPRARRVFHSDALGSVAALTDPDGLPTDTYAYSAFGSLRCKIGFDLNRVTYTGRERLGDSQGWMYYRHRVYAPCLGRFLSADPLGFIDTENTFIYVENLPVSTTDPLGYWGIQFGNINLGIGNPWLAFDSDSWGDLGRGFAATADGFIPFISPFSSYYEDECGNIDTVYLYSRAGGEFSRNILLTATALRGASAIGGTRPGHILNHNLYVRIGPGRMPARGGLPSGPKVPRLSIGNKPNGPHVDLRIRPID